ncbi:MAG: hypothetical protein NTW65_12575 [Deltaproteobacteria bacterium]|nr:hypothetical protein [Deltaproteobacteria bacterium]
MNNNLIFGGKIIIPIALLLLLFFGCASMMPSGKILYTGKDIEGDAKTGLIVVGSSNPQTKPYVMIGSPSNDIVFYLPACDKWELESGIKAPIFARNNQYMATVNIGTGSIDTPKEFYKKLMDDMRNSGKCLIRNVDEISIPGSNKLILRYQLKMTESPAKNPQWNTWKWSYWVAAPHNSKWYSLHLSVLDQNEEQISHEDSKIVYVLSLFDPGYFSRKR